MFTDRDLNTSRVLSCWSRTEATGSPFAMPPGNLGPTASATLQHPPYGAFLQPPVARELPPEAQPKTLALLACLLQPLARHTARPGRSAALAAELLALASDPCQLLPQLGIGGLQILPVGGCCCGGSGTWRRCRVDRGRPRRRARCWDAAAGDFGGDGRWFVVAEAVGGAGRRGVRGAAAVAASLAPFQTVLNLLRTSRYTNAAGTALNLQTRRFAAACHDRQERSKAKRNPYEGRSGALGCSTAGQQHSFRSDHHGAYGVPNLCAASRCWFCEGEVATDELVVGTNPSLAFTRRIHSGRIGVGLAVPMFDGTECMIDTRVLRVLAIRSLGPIR